MNRWTIVAERNKLKSDEGYTVEVEGRLIALFLYQDQVYAIDDCCPHMGASLAEGAIDDNVVRCPWHSWRFRLTDGEWVDCKTPGVKSYPVKTEGDNVLLEVTW